MPAGVDAFTHLSCDYLKIAKGQNWYKRVHLDKKYIYCLDGQNCRQNKILKRDLKFVVVDHK